MSTAPTAAPTFPSPGEAARQGGVPVNLGVPRPVKEAYDQRVLEEHGRTSTMASAALQVELEAEAGEGPVTGLRGEVDALLDAVGLPGREPKVTARDVPDGEEVRVQYHVSERLKDLIDAHAKRENFRSAGDYLAAVMWRYACGDGVLDRVSQAVDRAKSVAEEQAGDGGAAAQKPRLIAEGLRQRADGDLTEFSVDDFDAVIEETDVLKFGATAHARKAHLPDVLEELGFTWAPGEPGAFVDEAEVPDVRDPWAKPTYLIDDGDRELAIRVAGYAAVAHSNRAFAKLGTADVVTAVESVSNAIAAEHMRRAADAGPGFRFDADERVLKIDQRDVEAAPENADVLEIVTAGADTREGERETDGAPAGDAEPDWLEAAVEPLTDLPVGDLPDAVIRNKIARAKYPDAVDEVGVADDALEAVTADEIRLVREHLEAADGDNGGDGDDDTDGPDDPAAAADERMSEVLNAEVRADGGVVTEPPASDTDVDGPASPPEPAPAPDGETDETRLLAAVCPTDGQILSPDAHRDGRRWECPRCRQRWTPDRVFPDL